jgi:hypothetical protein
VDREVPGEPVAIRLQNRPRLVRDARVLEPRVREGPRDATVELGRRRRVHPLALVQALQIDDVDDASRGELRHDLVRPLVARIELEADLRIELAPLADGALGDREADRPRLAADDLGERAPRLPERKI